MKDHHYVFTIGLPNTAELYQFDSSRSKLLATDRPYVSLVLTRPLVPHNPITEAKVGTRFASLIIRQYDLSGTMMRQVEYKDVVVVSFNAFAPELVLEFIYKP